MDTTSTHSELTRTEEDVPERVPKAAATTGSRPNATEAISLFDPRLQGERKIFLKTMGLCLLLTTTFLFLLLPIYWGGYFTQEENLHRLRIGLLDLDSPACALRGVSPTVGPSLMEASTTGEKFHLGWEPLDSDIYDLSEGVGGSPRGVNAFEWAQAAVLNEDYYGIIIANANATLAPMHLLDTILNGSSNNLPYDGSGALTLIYTEARNFDTYDQWIQPGMFSLSSKTLPLAATAFAKVAYPRIGALSTESYISVNHTYLASIVASPFGVSSWNIRPLDAFAGIAATTIGMLYLLIFTFFISIFWNAARGPIESKIPLKQLIALRIGVPVFQYVFISLSISLLSLAFGVPFSRFYGRGGFVIFWLSNFLTQWGLGMMMEVAISLLGPKGTPFFLIFWVIINVSVAFLDMGDQSHFYAYGFIVPVFNAVDAAKSVAFGTKNHLGQNFGVNIAWSVGGSLLLAAVTACQRKRAVKRGRREKSS